MRIGHLTYNWEGTYLLRVEAEADSDIAFTLQPWSNRNNSKWTGQNWVQLSLAKPLLGCFQFFELNFFCSLKIVGFNCFSLYTFKSVHSMRPNTLSLLDLSYVILAEVKKMGNC